MSAPTDKCRTTSGPTIPPCPDGPQHQCTRAPHRAREPHSCTCSHTWGEHRRPARDPRIPRYPTPWEVLLRDGKYAIQAADGARVALVNDQDVADLIVNLVNTDAIDEPAGGAL